MPTFVGIDVAKASLTMALSPQGPTVTVGNDPAGWDALIRQLQPLAPPVIVLEATGGYEAGVVLALDAAGLTPAVINPLAARRFVQSLGVRAKTDTIDARYLALFAERQRPPVRPVPDETARTIRAVLDRHRQVTKMLVEEQNRLQQAPPVTAPLIVSHIAQLRTERTALQRLLEATIATDEWWSEQVARLTSVPGIGTLTAAVLLVGVPELGTQRRTRVASLVGVGPHPNQSGQFAGANKISGGRSWVRHLLYAAGISLIQHNPVLRAHYHQLRERGKAHKVAMIACLRRLLGILGAMCRDQLTWSETMVGQGRFLPAPLDT
jgi:transposase